MTTQQQERKITVTGELEEIMNAQMDIDREFFRRNPHARSYTRAVVPGEFICWQQDNTGVTVNESEIARVLVTNLGGGVRTRQPLFRSLAIFV